MKACNKCGNSGEFTKDKRNKDGLVGTCNTCRSMKRKGTHKYYPNLKYANKNAKKHIEAISDFYVIAELKRGTKLTTEDIKKFPELIQLKRQLIINKRKIKHERKNNKRPSQ